MEDGEKTPDERLGSLRERRENLRLRVAKIGGQAALGIHPGAVQVPGGQEDVLPAPSGQPEPPESHTQ